MEKKIRLNESDLEMLVKKIIKETEDHENGGNRYMFFSNLQQIKRQCEYLLEFDENQIEGILENGHDWAQDHIAEAKNILFVAEAYSASNIGDQLKEQYLL